MLTPGENYYRLFEGKMPEYVPIFDMMPYPGFTPAAVMTAPSCFNFHGPQGGKDFWGVEYIANPETNYSSIPKTWDFILEDIEDWRKVIVNPDLTQIDWKRCAEQDAEFTKHVLGVDRSKTLLLGASSGSFFGDLMAFMGFTNGLCAMMTDPEEVKALFEYMLEHYLNFQHYIIDYYSPDAIYLIDDTAAKMHPFISPEMFKELLLPYYKVLIDDAKDHGLPVQYHNCGRSEELMDMLFEAGVDIWDPAQTANDLLAAKQKYGKSKALAGCWDWELPPTWPEVDEAAIRKSVRDAIDKYAPGGGFAMCGGCNIIGQAGEDLPNVIRGWVLDEAWKYGLDFYKNHPEAVY